MALLLIHSFIKQHMEIKTPNSLILRVWAIRLHKFHLFVFSFLTKELFFLPSVILPLGAALG